MSNNTQLLVQFSNILDSILRINIEQHRQNVEQAFPDLGSQSNIRRHLRYWTNILAYSRSIRERFSSIRSVEGVYEYIRDIIHEYSQMFRAQQESNVSDWRIALYDLQSNLEELNNQLPQTFRFVNSVPDNEALNSMNQYINTAELIRQDGSFEEKIVYKLESHILNAAACIRTLSRGRRGYTAKTAFFAIAAPSMEGKTQSAYVFKRLKPLYFPLSTELQSVYRNFSALSAALRRYAEADIEAIKASGNYTRGTPFISASSIREDFQNIKFQTLGFLVHLVQDARAHFEASGLPWMRYHAQRQNFEFSALSFSDLSSRSELNFPGFAGFCLFLDEFIDSEWSVFVRNLARIIGLRCVVANTNSRIGNLVGRRRSSGADERRVWSIVVTRLDPTDQFILDRLCGLSTSITSICNMVESNEEKAAIRFFFDQFLQHHIAHLRPGISVFAAQVFEEFAVRFRTTPNRITLKVFLDFVSSRLSNRMTVRKPTLNAEDAAIYGNIGLLFPETFSRSSDDDVTRRAFFKSYRFLEYHLFYLQNPQSPERWIFYSFPPLSNRTFLQVPRGDNTMLEWKLEYTFFDKDELLGLLGCMFIPFLKPLTAILQDAERENASHRSRIGNSQNQNAPSRSGNLLEVSAAVSVVDASHHPSNYQISSFSGQSGTVFLNNLIVNLIKSPNFHKFTRKSVKYPTVGGFNLKKSFFDRCHIPFLYSINRDDAIFESICAQSPTVFVSKCTLAEELDSRFDFRFADQGLFQACIECKNYSSLIGSGKLHEILRKSLRNSPNSKLSLVFCESLVERSTANSAFTQFCLDHSINVYRVNAVQRGFEIVPFSASFRIFRVPRLVCILFESRKINQ